jgi:hypothetical protein
MVPVLLAMYPISTTFVVCIRKFLSGSVHINSGAGVVDITESQAEEGFWIQASWSLYGKKRA